MIPLVSSSQQQQETLQNTTIAPITDLHPDIINSHILNRLDGPTLASAAASSSHLRLLCTQQHLWSNICTAAWPSLSDPLAAEIIETFPATHRSIFSDAFPSLQPNDHKETPSSPPAPTTPELISAVDIFYKGKPIFSRVHRTQTQKGWFFCSPLWIDLIDPNEVVSTPLKFARIDDARWLHDIHENLGLSWIVIDPTRKRAANLSSRFPVSSRWHWLTGELEVVYAVVVEEEVQCTVKVTCCGKVGGEMQVREVSLTMEDAEGRHVMGRDSMVILQRVMENGKRKNMNDGELKEMFKKFCDVKRKRREIKLKKEKAMDMFVMFVALSIFAFLFWCLKV